MSIKHVSAIEYLDNSEREYNSKKVKRAIKLGIDFNLPSPGVKIL